MGHDRRFNLPVIAVVFAGVWSVAMLTAYGLPSIAEALGQDNRMPRTPTPEPTPMTDEEMSDWKDQRNDAQRRVNRGQMPLEEE